MNGIAGGLFGFRSTCYFIFPDNAMAGVGNMNSKITVFDCIVFNNSVAGIYKADRCIIVHAGIAGIAEMDSFDQDSFTTYSKDLVFVFAIKNGCIYSN